MKYQLTLRQHNQVFFKESLYLLAWGVCQNQLEVNVIVNSQHRPQTIAYVRITQQSWQHGQIEGEVRASQYEWQFKWCFQRGRLWVYPTLGRALIYEPLGRFLENYDYQLELGEDYQFTVRAEL